MKTFIKTIFGILFLSLVSTDFALAGQTELLLWKRDPFFYGACGHCADFVSFDKDENRGDFSSFPYYYQTGYYTINLSGPKGTAVTLFGDKNFSADHGYLTLIKLDAGPIEIENLEGFEANSWITRKAGENDSGAYRAFYHPYPQFKTRIASVKWGEIESPSH